MRTTEIAKI